MTGDFFWGFLSGFMVTALYMAYRSNIDSRTMSE